MPTDNEERRTENALAAQWGGGPSDREVACVNACAGMTDPEADIAALRAENGRLGDVLISIRMAATGEEPDTIALLTIRDLVDQAQEEVGEEWIPLEFRLLLLSEAAKNARLREALETAERGLDAILSTPAVGPAADEAIGKGKEGREAARAALERQDAK